ncbi:MAG: hypothetical protein EOO89_11315 [Pedobacter sp.]|nr:MAG: hypothetical protein EOO89_11315 [Pedobacter sp.]
MHIALADPDVVEGNNLYAEAEKKERQGDLNDALTLFGKAAFEYNNAKLKSRYALALMRMSTLHLKLNNIQAAEDIVLNVTLKIYTRLGSKSGEMNAYKQLGKIYLVASRFSESLWFFSQQGILAQQLKNKLSYIESVLDIARIKIKKKQFALATADVNRAELLAKTAKTTIFKKDISETRNIISQKRGS